MLFVACCLLCGVVGDAVVVVVAAVAVAVAVVAVVAVPGVSVFHLTSLPGKSTQVTRSDSMGP